MFTAISFSFIHFDWKSRQGYLVKELKELEKGRTKKLYRNKYEFTHLLYIKTNILFRFIPNIYLVFCLKNLSPGTFMCLASLLNIAAIQQNWTISSLRNSLKYGFGFFVLTCSQSEVYSHIAHIDLILIQYINCKRYKRKKKTLLE